MKESWPGKQCPGFSRSVAPSLSRKSSKTFSCSPPRVWKENLRGKSFTSPFRGSPARQHVRPPPLRLVHRPRAGLLDLQLAQHRVVVSQGKAEIATLHAAAAAILGIAEGDGEEQRDLRCGIDPSPLHDSGREAGTSQSADPENHWKDGGMEEDQDWPHHHR